MSETTRSAEQLQAVYQQAVYQLNEAIPELGLIAGDIVIIERAPVKRILAVREHPNRTIELLEGRSLTLASHQGGPPPRSSRDLVSWFRQHDGPAARHLQLL